MLSLLQLQTSRRFEDDCILISASFHLVDKYQRSKNYTASFFGLETTVSPEKSVPAYQTSHYVVNFEFPAEFRVFRYLAPCCLAVGCVLHLFAVSSFVSHNLHDVKPPKTPISMTIAVNTFKFDLVG